jgi:hypothetical protein
MKIEDQPASTQVVAYLSFDHNQAVRTEVIED